MTKKELDWRTLDGILQFNATKKMCAEILAVSEDVIERRIRELYNQTFTDYKDAKMGKVKIKLQQKAIELALAGNVTMLIFCLKNLCGWADRIEQDISTKTIDTQSLKEEASKILKEL